MMMATRKQNNRRRMVTIPWREDPDILRRLGWVAQLYHQPLPMILRSVNAYLTDPDQVRGAQPPVSYETIKADRERVRELLQERVVGNAQEHLMSLQLARESIERDILATEQGPARATLYAMLVRVTEDMARLDGTWTGGIIDAPPDEDSYLKGPGTAELMAAGKITREQHRANLLVIAVRTGAKLPPARPPRLIEGTARRVAPEPPRVQDVPVPVQKRSHHTFEADDL